MKPALYWQSLNAEEKQQLASKVGKSKAVLCNIFNGYPASLSLATKIAASCDGHVNPVDLLSDENRKALKKLSTQQTR